MNHMKTTATTEVVSSPPEEKWHRNTKWRRNTFRAGQKLKADWKKDLHNLGAGRKSRKPPTPFVGMKPYGKSQFRIFFKMKTLFLGLMALICQLNCVAMGDTLPTNATFFEGKEYPTGNMATNLTSYFRDVQLVNIDQMLKTNGLKCLVEISSRVPMRGGEALAKPPVCWVSLINQSTDFIGCLNMPVKNLCRVALLDNRGGEIQKTKLGEIYGKPLTQHEIEVWRNHWTNAHQTIYTRLTANGIKKYADEPSEICSFSIKDLFIIETPGEYELHLQLRLIQVGADSSGKLCYPISWLPEVVAKVQIRQEDVPHKNVLANAQTNSPAK